MPATDRIVIYVTAKDKKRAYAVAKRKGISASLMAYAALMQEVANREADRLPISKAS